MVAGANFPANVVQHRQTYLEKIHVHLQSKFMMDPLTPVHPTEVNATVPGSVTTLTPDGTLFTFGHMKDILLDLVRRCKVFDR